jgi:hypothetical protein
MANDHPLQGRDMVAGEEYKFTLVDCPGRKFGPLSEAHKVKLREAPHCLVEC